MSEIPAAVLSTIEQAGIRYVRFTFCDNAGLIRSKAVHHRFLAGFAAGGVGITVAQQALPAMYDAVVPGAGLSPAGEAHLRPDWSTFAPLPYAPGHARVMADAYEDEQPWPHCPRAFLRRMIARAEARGRRLMAAFENEFFLLRADTPEPTPVDSSVFAQTYALDQQAPVLDAITAALEVQGLHPEMIYAESGPGQFEMPIRYSSALAAADHQVAFRETVRAVAHRHGLIASFLPKIFVDKAGSGAHLHFSLWEGDRNLTADPDRPTTISAETAAFAAGLLDHLPALMALTIPSPNSFKRIRPHFWSGAYACWGYGNREAPIRVPIQPAGHPITNVELKTVDATCNPFIALGGVIAAGLDGLERGLTLGEPVQQDPGDFTDAERAARNIRPLPTTLGEALAALEQDRLLLDALGPGLADSFLAVRHAEWAALKDAPHDEEVRLLLERY